MDFFTHFNHWKKCHKQFFISSKYHRRKIIISTFLKCFTLHWLEYLVHFFTLSTNDDIKTPIFIARIYCIGSFFKPKKNPFLHSMKFPQMNIIYYATATLPEMICRVVVTTMWMHQNFKYFLGFFPKKDLTEYHAFRRFSKFYTPCPSWHW